MRGSTFLVIFVISVHSFGQTINTVPETEYDPLEGFPSSVIFECLNPSSANRAQIYVFDSAMQIPNHFVQLNEGDHYYVWRKAQRYVFGEPLDYTVASITIGEIGKKGYDFEGRKFIADPEENWLELDLSIQEILMESGYTIYEVVLKKSSEFIQITSPVPIEWRSLLSCFH